MTKKKKSLLPVLIAGVILLIIGGVIFLVNSRTSLIGRASPTRSYSLTNSYLFGSPLTAKADGKEKIKVSAFLHNDEGLGVPGKKVALQAPGVTIETNQSTTDENGQAIFYLTSDETGRFKVNAQVDGRPFPQELTVNFE